MGSQTGREITDNHISGQMDRQTDRETGEQTGREITEKHKWTDIRTYMGGFGERRDKVEYEP